MQKQPTTGLHAAAEGVATIVAQACDKVNGFSDLIQQLDKSVTINGKSQSLFDNYSRQLAHLALHYSQLPLDLSSEQVTDYLYLIKKDRDISESFFRFTVFAMRYVCKMRGLDYQLYNLPIMKHKKTLPIVLNSSDIKALLEVNRPLRPRLVIGLLYGCGLRVSEVCHLEVSHIDHERRVLHVHEGKGSKDRCLPLGKMLCRGISNYLSVMNPVKYLFENREATMVTIACIENIVKKAAEKAQINKPVHPHILRHTYATHLLEQGVSILIIQELLGHKRLETTLRYLHVTKTAESKIISPMDTLYGQQ